MKPNPDCLLWDSEGDAAEELTFEECKAVFQEYISGLFVYMEKA